MALIVDYKCPECHGVFEFMHHPRSEPPPSYCLLCDADMTPQKAVPKINIGTAKGKVGDQVYRQMEKASLDNAAAAVEMAGGDSTDYNAIKITDMRDNQREGDSAAMTQRADTAAKNLSYNVMGQSVRPEMQNPQAAQWAAATTSGPNALATRQMLDGRQASGATNADIAGATARGSRGKF